MSDCIRTLKDQQDDRLEEYEAKNDGSGLITNCVNATHGNLPDVSWVLYLYVYDLAFSRIA